MAINSIFHLAVFIKQDVLLSFQMDCQALHRRTLVVHLEGQRPPHRFTRSNVATIKVHPGLVKILAICKLHGDLRAIRHLHQILVQILHILDDRRYLDVHVGIVKHQQIR